MSVERNTRQNTADKYYGAMALGDAALRDAIAPATRPLQRLVERMSMAAIQSALSLARSYAWGNRAAQ
jgi:hypothetical protein